MVGRLPHDFKPLFYRRYVDDSFLIFKQKTHVKQFVDYLNTKHINIKFSSEIENNNSLPFLDLFISHAQNKFTTTIYRKPTFTGSGLNYISFIPYLYKINCIKTLFHRCFSITSTWVLFHNEINYLKEYFVNNSYPRQLLDRTLKSLLHKKFKGTDLVASAPKDIRYIKLPFYGHISYSIRNEINDILKKSYPQINFKFVFSNNRTIGSLFRLKDVIPDCMQSGVCYLYKCAGCNASYVGLTNRNLHSRIAEHLGVSLRNPNIKLTTPPQSHIRDHALSHSHPIETDNFHIIGRSSYQLDLKIIESLYIKKLNPTLNNNLSSIPLFTV